MNGGAWLMGGQQLITNGGFESSLSSWAATTSLYQSADSYVGNWAGNPRWDGPSAKQFYQRGFSVVAGREYFVRFAAKHGNVTTPSINLALYNYAIDSAWSPSEVFSLTPDWRVYGFGFTAGDTGSASLFFELPGVSLPPGSFHSPKFDAVTLYEAAEIGGDYSYKFAKIVAREDYITRTGVLRSWILSDGHREVAVPAFQISSAARCATNSFWHVGSPCFFVERAEAPLSLYSVKITGNDEPFQTLVHPYGLTYFMGTLTLETSSAN